MFMFFWGIASYDLSCKEQYIKLNTNLEKIYYLMIEFKAPILMSIPFFPFAIIGYFIEKFIIRISTYVSNGYNNITNCLELIIEINKSKERKDDNN